MTPVRVRGAGVVCALGVGAGPALDAIAAGREFGGFRGGTTDDGAVPRAAYPAPFDAARDLPRRLGRKLGRQLGMSLAAVLEAVGAERAWSKSPSDTGIVAATGHGPIDETVEFVSGSFLNGARYASPVLFSGALQNAMAAVAARELGLRGPAIVTAGGDVSFETALLTAVAALGSGRIRRAIVVGADAWHPLYAHSLSQFGLVSDSKDPVDPQMRRTTRGVHVGEGAGALVLEAAADDAGGGGPGVRIEEVRVGAPSRRRDTGASRVHALAMGDTASARRHAEALGAYGVDAAQVEYPAARFGAFASLSAVAIAIDAAQRLRSKAEAAARPSLFLSAPGRSTEASVTLTGAGIC